MDVIETTPTTEPKSTFQEYMKSSRDSEIARFTGNPELAKKPFKEWTHEEVNSTFNAYVRDRKAQVNEAIGKFQELNRRMDLLNDFYPTHSIPPKNFDEFELFVRSVAKGAGVYGVGIGE